MKSLKHTFIFKLHDQHSSSRVPIHRVIKYSLLFFEIFLFYYAIWILFSLFAIIIPVTLILNFVPGSFSE